MSWSLSVTDLAGETCAVLHEPGKMDYSVPITEQQQAWFNALKNLMRGDTWPIISASRIGLGVVGAQLRAIPHQNAPGWNRYDDATRHILHVWADGKSYDIHVPKEEFLSEPDNGQ